MPTYGLSQHDATGTELIPVHSASHEELEPVIGQLQSELRVLKLERAAILKRMGVIKKTIIGLADLYGSDVINDELRGLLALQAATRFRTHTGLTDLCRQLLSEASEPLTARQILGQIQERAPVGLVGDRHPLNSLRMILRRLCGLWGGGGIRQRKRFARLGSDFEPQARCEKRILNCTKNLVA